MNVEAIEKIPSAHGFQYMLNKTMKIDAIIDSWRNDQSKEKIIRLKKELKERIFM